MLRLRFLKTKWSQSSCIFNRGDDKFCLPLTVLSFVFIPVCDHFVKECPQSLSPEVEGFYPNPAHHDIGARVVTPCLSLDVPSSSPPFFFCFVHRSVKLSFDYYYSISLNHLLHSTCKVSLLCKNYPIFSVKRMTKIG